MKYRKVTLLISPTCSDVELAWAVGIYEGEGSASYTRTTNAYVAQKDPWLLERLQSIFGGSIWSNGRNSGCKRWSVSGPRARGFLLAVYPMLSPRRQRQADKALGPWKEEVLKTMIQ